MTLDRRTNVYDRRRGERRKGDMRQAQRRQTVQDTVPIPPVYDMLAWLMMDQTLRGTHYLTGVSNDMCTQLDPIDPVTGLGRAWMIKSHASGYPYDIEYYDNNFIYHSVTENIWGDPHTCKRFESQAYGLKGLPYPRFASSGVKYAALDSSYKIYSACSVSIPHNLGQVWFVVEPPVSATFGGNLTPDLPAIILDYFWNSGAKRERYYGQPPYGLVQWDTSDLIGNVYKVQKTVTFNQLIAGPVIRGFNPCNF
jgi:hypothetical protein